MFGDPAGEGSSSGTPRAANDLRRPGGWSFPAIKWARTKCLHSWPTGRLLDFAMIDRDGRHRDSPSAPDGEVGRALGQWNTRAFSAA